MAEYAAMFAVSGIATLLFLGGWNSGLVPSRFGDVADVLGPVGNVLNVIIFIAKGWILVFVMMWVRWTLPRLRIDQVMMTCLKYLLPVSCVLLVGVSIWQLAMPAQIIAWFKYPWAGICFLLTAIATLRVFTLKQAPPSSGMPGIWNAAPPSLETVGKRI
jgi:NADH-quinone oxidoreductase subunit H